MYQLSTIYQASDSPGAYARQYFERMTQLMRAMENQPLDAVIEAIEKTYQSGGTVFLIANGGSAAVASHFVNDAVAGAMIEGQPPFRALSLTDNVASVTALANDCGYDNIFACQIRMMMRPGDLLIAMSVSGNSENIIRGVEAAKALGCTTIGWAGFDGGRLAGACDLALHIPTTRDEYGPVEDMFSVLEHATITYLTLKRGRKLHH